MPLGGPMRSGRCLPPKLGVVEETHMQAVSC